VLQIPLPCANSSASKPPLSWSRPAVILPPSAAPPPGRRRSIGEKGCRTPLTLVKIRSERGHGRLYHRIAPSPQGSHGGKSRDNGGGRRGRLLSGGRRNLRREFTAKRHKAEFSAVLQQGSHLPRFDRISRVPLRVCSRFRRTIGFDRPPLPSPRLSTNRAALSLDDRAICVSSLGLRRDRDAIGTRWGRGSRVSLLSSAPPSPWLGDPSLLSDLNDS